MAPFLRSVNAFCIDLNDCSLPLTLFLIEWLIPCECTRSKLNPNVDFVNRAKPDVVFARRV
jgi:hypothetical protein